MYIKLFDIQNEKTIPTEHCFVINWLKKIMEEYPDNYIKVFSYLQYMCSWNPDDNPFLAMKEEDREEIILSSIDIDFSTEDETIQIALEKCHQLFDTPTYRLWKSAKNGLYKIQEYLDTNKVYSGKDGTNVDYRATLKDLPNLQKAYNEIYKDFMEETQLQVRGGKFNSLV